MPVNKIDKPFSEACEENKHPILAVLRRLFRDSAHVLEIGSGTGQHGVFFAGHMPHLLWQTSDLPANHPGIRAWLDEAGLDNLLPPLALDVGQESWPANSAVDGVFSANTTHIMDWGSVVCLFRGVGKHLRPGGLFVLYGPFRYGGSHTSESNARFDAWLKARDPRSGIKDFEALNELAAGNGMALAEDIEMPVNNRILAWLRQ